MSVPKGKKYAGKASEARVRFLDASDDVRSYFALWQMLRGQRAARDHLVVASRGVFVLVAAMWEAFCEDLAHESARLLVEGAGGWRDLPPSLARTISRELREDRDELSAWRLAGDAWRDVALTRIERIAMSTVWNTPKAGNVDSLFEKALGLKGVSDGWHTSRAGDQGPKVALNEAIALRGGIAHGEKNQAAIGKAQVSAFYQLTADLAECTEESVGTFIAERTGRDPWPLRRISERAVDGR
ncbi:MAG: HEPN domain-containing protein [Motilibacteraceae bacterium]